MHRAGLYAIVTLFVAGGCVHRTRSALRIGDLVRRPANLDSAATEKWVAAQRAACPARLTMVFDEMPTVDVDGVARYHSWLAAVQCTAP